MEKSTEQVLADARRRIREVEASMLQASAAALASLTAAEDTIRELTREVARKKVEIFTEAEFAKLCKVSSATIWRLRKAGKIQPLMIGGMVRYSSVDHLEKVGEIFAARRLSQVPQRRRTGT